VLPDRTRKLVQFSVIKEASWIAWIAADKLDRHHSISADIWSCGINRDRLIHLTDQCGEAAAKPSFRDVIVHV
jgi:hypothetical protein